MLHNTRVGPSKLRGRPCFKAPRSYRHEKGDTILHVKNTSSIMDMPDLVIIDVEEVGDERQLFPHGVV